MEDMAIGLYDIRSAVVSRARRQYVMVTLAPSLWMSYTHMQFHVRVFFGLVSGYCYCYYFIYHWPICMILDSSGGGGGGGGGGFI